MGSILKELVVKILGDSSSLQKTYDAMSKESKKFGKEVEKNGVSLQAVGKVMMAVGGTITGALAATVVAATKGAGEIEHLSRVAGTSAESFQKLAYAAKQDDVDMQSLSGGLVKLSKNMASAATGSGDAAKAFKSIGVNVQTADGHLRTADQVLLDVAARFKEMTNPAEKTALALQLFGKSGANLVPFLEQGKDGIQELSAEAKRLGLILSNESISQLDAFGDELDNVKAAVGGFGSKIGADLVPYMQLMVDWLKTGLEWINKIPQPVRQATTVGMGLAGAVAAIGGAFIVLGPAIGTALAPMWGWIAIAAGVGAAAVVVYNNWYNVAAFLMTVGDKIVEATRIAWADIRILVLSGVKAVLIGLQTLTGWIPGWGDKLKSAICAVENQIGKAACDVATNQQALTQSRYKEHYNWMVAHNKKKNKTILDQDRETERLKTQALKDAEEERKKEAERAEKERIREEEERKREAREREAREKEERERDAKERARKKDALEKEWGEKLKNNTIANLNEIANDEKKSNAERIAALRKALDQQLQLASEKYEKEKAEAAEVNADITALDAAYNQEKIKLKNDATAKELAILKVSDDEQEEIRKKAIAKEEELEEQSAQKIIDDEKKSINERTAALNDFYKLKQAKLNAAYTKEASLVKKGSDAELKLQKNFNKESENLEQERQNQLEKITLDGKEVRVKATAEEMVAMLNEIGSGSSSILDVFKDYFIKNLSAVEVDVIAKALAGISTATSFAPGTWGASLAWIPGIKSNWYTAVAEIETAKAGIRALATGGLATGPSVNLIGEGDYEEAVLPLSPAVFKQLGAGIVANQQTNNQTSNNNNATIINNNYLGKYVDRSGLKRFVRDINDIQNQENARKGKK